MGMNEMFAMQQTHSSWNLMELEDRGSHVELQNSRPRLRIRHAWHAIYVEVGRQPALPANCCPRTAIVRLGSCGDAGALVLGTQDKSDM